MMKPEGVRGNDVSQSTRGVSVKNGFNFDSAVFACYMERGKPCTAKQIAEHSGVSIKKVRDAIRESRYRSICTTVDLEIRDRNYGRLMHYRRTDAYQPSLTMMRVKIQELEQRLAATGAVQGG